jgi:hypothetical protein
MLKRAASMELVGGLAKRKESKYITGITLHPYSTKRRTTSDRQTHTQTDTHRPVRMLKRAASMELVGGLAKRKESKYITGITLHPYSTKRRRT